MKLAFHGAARTVTGSKHLLTLANNKSYLLDCGLYQGMGHDTYSLNGEWGFDPSHVNCLILSHAHIDHSGLIPKLVKDGFNGTIFCTPATNDLAAILLEDSAGIQEDEAKYLNKRRASESLPRLEPLYSRQDAERALRQFRKVEYDTWHRIDDNVELLYRDAGHIIGSASVHLRILENGKTTTLSFSGDVGRYHDMILKAPQPFPQADYIIIESTYGDKLHEVQDTAPDLLLKWIQKACMQKKGKLIIPAFSVGRTQELLFLLNQLEEEGRLPHLDYFVDSPMSIEVTEVVKRYPAYFNDGIQQVMRKDKDPFMFSGLKYIETVEQSKLLNFRNGPFVIISASGMAEGGRVKHHISNNIENSRNTILMVGYCEPHSLGGRLLSGAKDVNIFGVHHEVNAEVGSIKSMSAHGDYNDLCEFLSCQDPAQIKKIFLVHGDYDVQLEFRRRLLAKGYIDVEIPERHSEFGLD